MQSKAKPPVISLADIGYKTAENLEGNMVNAQMVMDKDSKFPNEITEETLEGLTIGFQRKYHEKKGSKLYYKSVDEKTKKVVWIPIAKLEDAPKGKETIDMNLNFALSVEPFQYGEMKKNDPEKRALVETLKTQFTKYKHDCLKALIGCAKKIIDERNGVVATTRKSNKNFIQTLEYVFNDPKSGLDKKVKTLKNKSDLTADPVLYKMAKEAFFKVYTKK